MQARIIILISILLLNLPAMAQNEFRRPVKKEAGLRETLFELEAYKQNHIFQAVMPGDNFLLIDFYRMSYWPDSAMLPMIFEAAKKAATGVSDSFANALTSKRVDVHMPVDNSPLQVRITDHHNADMVVLQYGQQSPLKLGMDTIRILKTVAVTKDKEGNEQRDEIQYTFILKDIDEIIKLADNKQLIADIARTFDREVQYRRSRWKREDTWYHTMGIRYTATGDRKTEVKKEMGFISKALGVTYYLGASVFMNNVTPNIEIGVSYRWPGDIGEYDYVRFSTSTLAHFERNSERQYNFYNSSFLGFELGSMINRTDTWIPIYETSIGMAYMFTDHPFLRQHKAVKMFWHYSLSPSVRITPEVFLLFRNNTNNYIFPGITLSLRLL